MKTTTLIVIIILILMAAAAVYYGLISNYQNPSVSPEQQPAATPPATSSEEMSAPSQATQEITIKNFSFSPSSVIVARGTTVVWTNQDPVAHTVTSDTNAFNSGSLIQGRSFQFQFNETGTYDYMCSIHPSMRGEIIVQ
jgi:plastocyanin